MIRQCLAIICLALGLVSGLSAYELSVIAMFRDEAPYLKEWIDYHQLVGVEHFWLYDDHSKDQWQDVLQPYIQQGIVDVIQWPDPSDTYGYTRQLPIYRHGIRHAVGKTTWLAVIDIDEFLVPMTGKSVSSCLKQFFSTADAIFINWLNFGTGGVTLMPGESMLSKLTACSLKSHSRNCVGKCIVKPEKVDVEAIWSPHHLDLIPGSRYLDGSAEIIHYKDGNSEFSRPHSSKFLRINHYSLRDEYFFWNYRYQRMGEKALLLEHYDSFSQVRDYTLSKMIGAP